MSPVDRPITSTANPRVRAALALRDRGERDRTGLTIVDGARELLRGLDAGVEVETGFVCQGLLRTPDALTAGARLRGRSTTVEVDERVIGRIAFGDRSDGVVAVVRTPQAALADLESPADALLIVVEAVEKPGNLGAIMRSADGAGADAVIAADPRTDAFNPNAIRASIGTIFSRPVVTAGSAATLEWLVERGIRPVAARVDVDTEYTSADLTGPLAIVLGSEAQGLSATWRDRRVETVAIPMRGAADSLNVSVAAAVLLYEARRQRGSPRPRKG